MIEKYSEPEKFLIGLLSDIEQIYGNEGYLSYEESEKIYTAGLKVLGFKNTIELEDTLESFRDGEITGSQETDK